MSKTITDQQEDLKDAVYKPADKRSSHMKYSKSKEFWVTALIHSLRTFLSERNCHNKYCGYDGRSQLDSGNFGIYIGCLVKPSDVSWWFAESR